LKLLTDAHALFWWPGDYSKLNPVAREAIASPEALVYVSAVTVWEVAIKRQVGKIRIDRDLVAEIATNGFVELAISAKHADAQGAGYLPRHNDDPFGRMLTAEAQIQGLPLISRVGKFEAYGVPVLRA